MVVSLSKTRYSNIKYNQPYIKMSEIIWATPIAMSTAMAVSEWKRELDEASTVFKTWK